MSQKCPNCAGDMQRSGSKYICPYCDTEITVEQHQAPQPQAVQSKPQYENEKESSYYDIALSLYLDGEGKLDAIQKLRNMTGLGLKEAKELMDRVFDEAEPPQSHSPNAAISQKLLRINSDVTASENAAKTMRALCNALDSEYSTDQYINLFRQIASAQTNCATPDVHSDLFKKAYSRLSSQLEAGEQLLLWMDNGVFIQSAKEGVAISNKNLFFVKKKDIFKSNFKDLFMLKKGLLGNWHLNGNSNYWLNTIGCSDEQLGIVMAYIFMNAKEQNGEDFRIDVYSE